MKKYLPFLFITVALTGCESVYLPSLKEVPVRPINVKQGDTASKTPAGKTGHSTSQSKLYIQNALRGWQQRWKSMTNKPSNPAFTNFLMEVMSMTPLQ